MMFLTKISTFFTTVTLFTASINASPLLSKRQTLATVYSSCTVPNTVAITFDDGPYIYLQQIVDILSNAGAKGTFFFNGNNFDCIYSADSIARVKYAFDHGHQIASHTWSHGDLTTFTTTQIQDGMYRVEEAFSRIVGVTPAFVRPPYGATADTVRAVAASRGQSLAMWDWDTGDADGNTTAQAEAVYDDAVNAKVSNMLVLNHETQQTTADSLIPYAVKLLQSHGYKLVTLAECVGGLAPYSQVGVAQAQTADWTCAGTPAPGEGCTDATGCKTGQVTVVGGTGAGGVPIPNQVIHPSADSTKCLAAASNTNNAAVVLEPCDGSASQSWTLSGTSLQIFGSMCLDLNNGNAADGSKLQIYSCNAGNANQAWTTPSPGGAAGSLQWKGHNNCLDNTGGVLTAGNPTQIWTCTGGPNQQWAIAAPGAIVPSGKLIKPNASSSNCLTVQTNSDQAPVIIEPCTGGASQLWTQTSSGTLTIYGGTKCLDVTSGSTANGVKMQVYSCTSGNTNQKFTVTAAKQIQWTGKNECLDLTNGSVGAGNVVQMWACSAGNMNQVWNFV